MVVSSLDLHSDIFPQAVGVSLYLVVKYVSTILLQVGQGRACGRGVTLIDRVLVHHVSAAQIHPLARAAIVFLHVQSEPTRYCFVLVGFAICIAMESVLKLYRQNISISVYE